MEQPQLSEQDRVRLEQAPVCNALRGDQGRLLRFLLNKTLAGAPPNSRTILQEHYGIEKPTGKELPSVRDKISKLRGALIRYYAGKGANDSVALKLIEDAEREGYRVLWEFRNASPSLTSQGEQEAGAASRSWIDSLFRSGLTNAFRMKQHNAQRLQRITELIQEELVEKEPYFRVAGLSGFNHLNSKGSVWQAGLGQAVSEGRARLEAVLESPFSDFAFCRAVANEDTRHHWESGVDLAELSLWAKLPNVAIHVTDMPLNCALFFTSKSVYYDPYLWARPSRADTTEHNFWVFEFRKCTDANYDCYGLIGKHFDFLWRNSMPLQQFLKGDPFLERGTKLFEQRAKARIGQLKRTGRRR